MPRRYNPYYGQIAQPYQSQDQDLIYNPIDQTDIVNRYADILGQKQSQYDAARFGVNQFEGQLGQTQTPHNEMLQQRISEFTDNAEKMVETQYGGDWGAARHDLIKAIGEEKSSPFYKAVAEQNKQVDLRQKAQMKDPNAFFAGFGAQDIGSQEALQSAIGGDYSALQEDYGYEPDRETIAGKLISRVKPNTYNDLFKELSVSDQKLLEEQGITDLSGLLMSQKQTGISTKRLNKLKDSFVNSLLESDNTLVKQYGKEGARAKATEIIENNIPQFAYSRTDKKAVDLRPKTKEVPEVKNPIYFGGYKNAGSNQYTKAVKDYGTKKGQIDLNTMPNLESFKVKTDDVDKKLLDAQKLVTKITGRESAEYRKQLTDNVKRLKAEKEKIDKISDFKIDNKDIYTAIKDHEKTYGNITKIDDGGNEVVVTEINEKAHILADLNDKKINKESKFLAFDDEALINKLQAKWEAGRIGDVYSMQGFEPSGDIKYEKQDEGSIDVSGKWLNYGDKSKLNILGINAKEGRIVVQDNKGRKAEFYPSENAKYFASQNKKVYKNLDTSGYSIDNDVYQGGKTLTVRIHNPRRATNNNYGAISEYTMQIPKNKLHLLSGISNKKEAIKIFEQLDNSGEKSYPTESLIQNKMYQYSGGLGFTQQGSIAD